MSTYIKNSIFYTDLSKVVYTSNHTSPIGFTPSALNNYVPTSRWVGVSGSSNVLTITFPTPKACNAICIENHNFKYFTDDILLETAGYSLNLNTDNDDPIYWEFDNTITQQVWTITIPSSSDMSPYIGNVFLDKLLTFNIPPSANLMIGNIDSRNTYRHNLKGTIRNAGTKDTKWMAELNFPFMADQMKNDFIVFFKTNSKYIPFYYIDNDRNVKYMLVDADYVPITIMRYKQNALFNFKMRSFDLSNSYIAIPIEMIPTQFYVTSVT